ncbi:MAG: bifunctional oligoribonuclease/PAP phosphatase NrnA [Nitrospinae bacterium]|nr:bifunctional oligoribonuclease/PAP phosphatase NrnA [Nitrospinota bacterium]
MQVPSSVVAFLSAHQRYLVSTHVNPDGDGLGSAMALRWALNRSGKRAEVVIESAPPSTYDYFADFAAIGTFERGNPFGAESPDALVIVDAPTIERLGKVAGLVPAGTPILIIDHHPADQWEGDVLFVESTASSSAELVYRVVKAMGQSVDTAAAVYLYSGLIIDTGRFRFSNTSPSALVAASELVAAGAEPHTISERLFHNNSWETTKALGRLIDTIELHAGGKIATCHFTLDFVTSPEWKKIDTEGFVNHALAIQGVEVAALLREAKPGVTRASLRAKHTVDVNKIAQQFGGGGHAKAAGLTIEAPLMEARATLLAAIEKALG